MSRRGGLRVAIVGGGVMGVRAAWACARRGAVGSVVLLEQRALAAGSSGRSGAVLRQHYASEAVAAMARDSLLEYATLEARTGRAIGFQACGVLTIAGPRSQELVERVRANVAMQRTIGIDTRLVDAQGIRELVPGIAVLDGTVAAYEPTAGFCDPNLSVHAFAALAQDHGAELRIGEGVRAVEVEHGRAAAVRTDAGRVEVDAVVLAAGPWTRRLTDPLGIDLPLEVVRPQQHFVASLAPPAAERASHPVLLDLELGYYTRCDPRFARTRIGALEHRADLPVEDPDAFDERVDPAFVAWARTQLAERLPSYRSSPDLQPQAALYTLTPDSQPILGRVREVAGLFVASGFSGHGFKLAPSVGEGLAQLVCGEPVTAFDEAFFDARRFRGARGGDPRAFGI